MQCKHMEENGTVETVVTTWGDVPRLLWPIPRIGVQVTIWGYGGYGVNTFQLTPATTSVGINA